MELTTLRTAKAGTLTAEQRKRASLAVELLTDPSLLVFEEPTAGLEPEAAQKITATLRQLADDGRVVLVATTTPTELDACDQVVMLTPTGIPVFAGAPSEIEPQLGTTDWAKIVKRARTDPVRRTRRIPGAPTGAAATGAAGRIRLPDRPRTATKCVAPDHHFCPPASLADDRRSAVPHLPGDPADAVRRDLVADTR